MSRPGPSARINDAFHVIVDAVSRGLPPKAACHLAAVSAGTFYRWMRYGEQEATFEELREADPSAYLPDAYDDGQLRSRVYLDFMTSVLKARAQVALVAVERVVDAAKAGPQFWQSAAWMLERQFPESFAQTTRTEVTGRGGGAVEVVTQDRQELIAQRVLEQAAVRKQLAGRAALLPPPGEEAQ